MQGEKKLKNNLEKEKTCQKASLEIIDLKNKIFELENRIYNLEHPKKATIEDMVNRDLTGASIGYKKHYLTNMKNAFPKEFAESINASLYEELFQS